MEYDKPMLRDNALKGEVIIVTGGGSGLGKAMTAQPGNLFFPPRAFPPGNAFHAPGRPFLIRAGGPHLRRTPDRPSGPRKARF